VYKKVKLVEGADVQYVGTYVTSWQYEYGLPDVGFVEDESVEKQMFDMREILLRIISEYDTNDAVRIQDAIYEARKYIESSTNY